MSKPTILAVDDDPVVLAAITRDIRSRYAADYRVVRATSGEEALTVLAKLALRNQSVALIATDQRMPQMTGIQLLEQARTHAGGAKFLLLTAYADTDVAIKAINDVGLDYYLLKPGDRVVIEIADTGPGMPPQVAARAFEPFYTTKDVGKGTGLGLDIARRIITERHGGTITIDSRSGETILRVRIPVQPP